MRTCSGADSTGATPQDAKRQVAELASGTATTPASCGSPAKWSGQRSAKWINGHLADTLRTYTKYDGPLADVVRWTIRDLRAIAPVAADLGVLVVLENHEDFTGPVLARILGEVAHPSVRALYDYGNSQMVGEDPLVALAAMSPYVARVHAKDHVLIHGPHGPVVQGVPFGSGNLPVGLTTDRLYLAGVRRFCFENVWSYVAPLKVPQDRLPDTACFAFADRSRYLMGDELPPARAVREERIAFAEGLAAFRRMLAERGYLVRPGP